MLVAYCYNTTTKNGVEHYTKYLNTLLAIYVDTNAWVYNLQKLMNFPPHPWLPRITAELPLFSLKVYRKNKYFVKDALNVRCHWFLVLMCVFF